MKKLTQLKTDYDGALSDLNGNKVAVEMTCRPEVLSVQSKMADLAKQELTKIIQRDAAKSTTLLDPYPGSYGMHPANISEAERAVSQINVGLKQELENKLTQEKPHWANAYLLGTDWISHNDSFGFSIAVQYYKIKEDEK